MQRVKTGANFHFFHLIHCFAVGKIYPAPVKRKFPVREIILYHKILCFLRVDKWCCVGILSRDNQFRILKTILVEHFLNHRIRARRNLIDHAPREGNARMVTYIINKALLYNTALCPLFRVCQNCCL